MELVRSERMALRSRSFSPFSFLLFPRLRAYHSLSRTSTRAITTTLSGSESRQPEHLQSTPLPRQAEPKAPLAILPLSNLLRSYILALITTTPIFLNPSLSVLSAVTQSRSRLLSPDRNPLLHWLLKKTLYTHFCAGENEKEVRSTVAGLHRLGFQGVILSYGKEEVTAKADDGATQNITDVSPNNMSVSNLKCIQAWRDNVLLSLRAASTSTDFVALKFTGAGPAAVRSLSNGLPMPLPLDEATKSICDLARERNIPVLVDAEQSFLQPTVDKWTLRLQHLYNRPDGALVYSTYQAYRTSIPLDLSRDLAFAAKNRFALGVKLVRGAYLAHDPRENFWKTKELTDRCFDGIAEALITRQWNEVLQPCGGSQQDLPTVDLMLATHNRPSVQKALVYQRHPSKDLASRPGRTRVCYAQLMGMADEVSCDLLAAAWSTHPSLPSSKPARSREQDKPSSPDVQVYKYTTWGTLGECLKYLLRRAQENKDAVERTREGRKALGEEIARRIKGLIRVRRISG